MNGKTRLVSGWTERSRTLIARVTRVEAIGPKRFSYEFDGIDAQIAPENVERLLSGLNDIAPFALARAITTPSRLYEMCGGIDVEEGDWVEIEIVPQLATPAPLAFLAPLTDVGYSSHVRGRLGSIRHLGGSGDGLRPLPELSASVASIAKTANKVRSLSTLPRGAIVHPAIAEFFLAVTIGRVDHIQVRDVGQASFVTIRSDRGKLACHFDAGWPISFNGHTAPKILPHAVNRPVILSHWDWDHLHGYHRLPELAEQFWLAPDQQVGPGAAAVAASLHRAGRLLIYPGPDAIRTRHGTLHVGSGASLNNSGFALEVRMPRGGTALLVGDGDYGAFPTLNATRPRRHLVATHHGAHFLGTVPTPFKPQRNCVVSVGRGNVYRHPSAAAICAHETAGWDVGYTSSHGGPRRGDRRFP